MKVNRKNLELAMARACMNTEDLTIASELPRPTINNAITGRGLRPKTVGKLARALNVPVEELIEEV